MRRPSARTAFIVLMIVLVVAGTLEIALGPLMIPIGKIIPETWAYFHGGRGADAVVMGAIRWPRLFIAMFVGAGLASTGAALQAVFRNPMADPAIIGVSSGGSLGAVIVIQLGLAQLNQWYTPLGAFISGLLVVLVIYRLATIQGKT